MSERVQFLGAAPSMLARLIDDRSRDQLHGIEIAHGEAIEPGLAFTCEAPKSSARPVPLSNVHAVGAALAQEHDSHGRRV
jgi:hypothetical protein